MKPNEKHNQVRSVLGMNNSNVKNGNFESKYTKYPHFYTFMILFFLFFNF